MEIDPATPARAMTLEERAREVLNEQLGHAAGLLDPIMALNVRGAMLAFAAEERERCARVAEAAVERCPKTSPSGWGGVVVGEHIAIAIRNLGADQ